jgi:ATP-binding cassette subfamily B protein
MGFPHFSQLEYSDCGATCLKIILKYYGRDCSLAHLRELCETTRVGVSIADIMKAAEKLRFSTLPVLTSTNWLVDNGPLPCIIHWKQEHFVVLYKVTKKYYYISDPAYGKVKLNQEDFCNWWKESSTNGIALFLEPGEDFYEQELPFKTPGLSIKSSVHFLADLAKGMQKYFYLLGVIMSLLVVLVFLFPKTVQVITDVAIKNKDVNALTSVFLFQLLLILGQNILSWIQDWIRVRISMTVNIRMVSQLLHKIVKLPVRFFDIKTPTDILQRIGDQRNIESFLSDQIMQTFFSLAMAIILTSKLFIYSFHVGLIFIGASLISILWVLIFFKWRQRIDYTNFRLASENYNLVNEFIYGMVEIKINEAQEKKIRQWDNLQRRIFDLRKRSLHLGVFQNTGVQILSQFKNIGISFLCAYLVIQGGMTLGTMLSVGFIVGLLSSPIESLVGFSKSAQDAQLSFFRLEEIRSRKDEVEPFQKPVPAEIEEGIRFNDVSFKYDGGSSQFVLRNVDLNIPYGKTTAIVGSSGSGKSTLVKLLLNFYTPQIGTIQLNGRNLSEYNPDTWRKRCGIVLQDGYIFSGTIAENIALGDAKPDMERLRHAAYLSCLDEFIQKLPMKFETKIGATGMGISGGQKQRLLIARAIYNDPDFIILDEATSNLDANNERRIMQNMADLFKNKTIIIIAHRLSTVKNADQIIVLENGVVIERGIHESLVNNKGRYFDLIKNQLELGQ